MSSLNKRNKHNPPPDYVYNKTEILLEKKIDI